MLGLSSVVKGSFCGALRRPAALPLSRGKGAGCGCCPAAVNRGGFRAPRKERFWDPSRRPPLRASVGATDASNCRSLARVGRFHLRRKSSLPSAVGVVDRRAQRQPRWEAENRGIAPSIGDSSGIDLNALGRFGGGDRYQRAMGKPDPMRQAMPRLCHGYATGVGWLAQNAPASCLKPLPAPLRHCVHSRSWSRRLVSESAQGQEE